MLCAAGSSSDPLLSVVLPYRGERTAGRAIRSVLNQSIQDIELLVVDDASPDHGAHLPSCALSGDRVRVLRHETRRGAAAARNTGVRSARATTVAFLDSDDTWAPTMVERQLTALAAATAGTVGVTTGFSLLHASGAVQPRVGLPAPELLEEAVQGCRLAPGSTLAIQRDVWLDVGGEDETMERLEDWDLLFRLAKAGLRLAYVEQSLARIAHSLPGPSMEVVRRSANTVLCRHQPWVEGRSTFLALRLRATTSYEIGLAALRHRQPLRATSPLLRSLVLDPAPRITALRRAASRWVALRSNVNAHPSQALEPPSGG